MIDYNTFDHTEFKVESIQDGIDILEMFAWQFNKKECAMTSRDEKWAGGLQMTIKLLKHLKENNDDFDFDLYRREV